MEIKELSIKGLLVITPDVFQDSRGYFMESHNRRRFQEATGLDTHFLQDNESMSNKGVLRGLHFQVPPNAQDKLVRVVQGKVADVAVDLRRGSPTYGKYEKVILSAGNKKQLFIPKGFAHGFLVLEDETIFCYKCSAYYHKESERTLPWNDRDINIDWNFENPTLSEKDASSSMTLASFESPFEMI